MKTILIKLNLEGQGIVNFDDSNQRWMFNGTKFKNLFHPHNNVKYSKKVFFKDSNGDLSDIKIKISDKCLKRSIFGDDMVGQNTNYNQNTELLFSQIGSPLYLLSGYMLTVKNGLSYKRKSPVTLSDAIQTNDAYPSIETCTRSGKKMVKETSDDKSDTSLFNMESIGDITYQAKGFINLNELQFISLDDYYDRWSFSVDEFSLFEKYIKMQMNSFESKPGYFKIKDSQNSFPELGIKFSDEDVNFLVKYYLKRALKLRILRNSAFAQVKSLQIKFVDDCVTDTFDNSNGWIDIKSLDDINNLNVKCDDYYVEVDENEAKDIRSKTIQLVEEVDVNAKKKEIKKKLKEV